MVGCEIIDFRCVFVNEIVGNPLLAAVFVAIFYFIIASKLKLGFESTIGFAFPLILIGGLMIAGFSAVYAFATILVALMIGWLFNKVIGN